MSLTLNTAPSDYQLSKNPVVAQLTTDAFETGGAMADLQFDFTGTNNLASTLTFKWADETVVFTFVAAADASGTELTEKGGKTTFVFLYGMISEMKVNELIDRDFNVTLPAGNTFMRLEAKKVGAIYNLTFAQNNSGFVFLSDTTGVDKVVAKNYKMVGELRKQDLSYFAIFDKVGEMKLSPLDNVCIFDFKEIVNAYLDFDLPTFNQTAIAICEKVFHLFKIRYYERFGSPVVDQVAANTAEFYVLKGGVPRQDFVGTTKLVDSMFITPGNFLTKQPRIKNVVENQQEYLYFITPAAADAHTGDIFTRATITFKDHRDVVVVDGAVTAPASKKCILIPTGFTQINLIAQASFAEIASYTLEIIHDGTGDKISEVFTYLADADVYLDETTFLFTNTYGGVDTFRCTGLKENAFAVDKQRVGTTLLFNTAATVGAYRDVNAENTGTFSVNTGFISKAQADWLEALFSAEYIFIIKNNSYIPVVIDAVKQGKYNSKQGKTSYDIKYSTFNN